MSSTDDYAEMIGIIEKFLLQMVKSIKTYVVVKRKNKWLLAHDHNTVVKDN
ncbi:hypothetical protein [Aquiflexum sp.]|uniref:hypothetical protein n=1 Tax=Aquiflexum sp. TaxID=1872584 RepID=UPI0035938ABD